MARQMYPVAGCSFFIGNAAMDSTADDMDDTDFASVSWTQVKGWVTMGASGDAAALVTSDQIDSQRTRKAKGVRNAGSMENVFDVIADDAGQLKMITAEQSSATYPFRIVYNDKPAGADATPSESLFVGLVMSQTRQGGGANDPRRIAFTIEIDSNVVFVDADDGA